MTSAATKLPGGHALNAGAAIISFLCLIWYLQSVAYSRYLMTLMAFLLASISMGIGGADMPVVVSMLTAIQAGLLLLLGSARK